MLVQTHSDPKSRMYQSKQDELIEDVKLHFQKSTCQPLDRKHHHKPPQLKPTAGSCGFITEVTVYVVSAPHRYPSHL